VPSNFWQWQFEPDGRTGFARGESVKNFDAMAALAHSVRHLTVCGAGIVYDEAV
jgi:hypothetical protein